MSQPHRQLSAEFSFEVLPHRQAEALRELGELRDVDIITDEEFEATKKVLDRL
ncbi:SHOCT domain-containing protein [Actinomadura rudentiformis]|uniref:SHOCT domain-containing protein n=1 Tax=Actinomadura rudentiformis TaxID=359158 RepID=A0A6H9YJ74_9ACTN|nr:SHOCT domain-containing protein [Actinomadura rudentiformis]KAB2337052.1 SHOCT domain-containing protein [Actinomadura rudentiformis]